MCIAQIAPHLDNDDNLWSIGTQIKKGLQNPAP